MNIKNKIIQKMLFIVMWCFLISFTACTSDDSTTDTQQEQQEQQEQTQVEQPPQQAKIATEQEYFEKVQPFIEQIIVNRENIWKILENSSNVEEWKEAIPYAQNCIALSKEIRNLKATDELLLEKEIVELGVKFGLTVERVNNHFIEGLETQNMEELQNWIKKEDSEIVTSWNEINAYVQGGKPIQEQLREELSTILSDEEIENVNIVSETATFAIYAMTEEKEGLIKICEILKIMGSQSKYDYLNTYFVIGYPYPGSMFLIPVRVTRETRQGIDLNTINDTNIIDIADEYSVVSSEGVILYKK